MKFQHVSCCPPSNPRRRRDDARRARSPRCTSRQPRKTEIACSALPRALEWTFPDRPLPPTPPPLSPLSTLVSPASHHDLISKTTFPSPQCIVLGLPSRPHLVQILTFDPRLEHLHGHVVSQRRPSELLVTWLRGGDASTGLALGWCSPREPQTPWHLETDRTSPCSSDSAARRASLQITSRRQPLAPGRRHTSLTAKRPMLKAHSCILSIKSCPSSLEKSPRNTSLKKDGSILRNETFSLSP